MGEEKEKSPKKPHLKPSALFYKRLIDMVLCVLIFLPVSLETYPSQRVLHDLQTDEWYAGRFFILRKIRGKLKTLTPPSQLKAY